MGRNGILEPGQWNHSAKGIQEHPWGLENCQLFVWNSNQTVNQSENLSVCSMTMQDLRGQDVDRTRGVALI